MMANMLDIREIFNQVSTVVNPSCTTTSWSSRALEEAGSNRSRAARLLGITRSQLYYRMQKHGLAPAS